MTSVILILVAAAVVLLILIIVLVVQHFKDMAKSRAITTPRQELTQMSRQARAQAQEKISIATEKEVMALHKLLQAQAQSISSEFSKQLQATTNQQLKAFEAALSDTLMASKAQITEVTKTGAEQAKLAKENLTKQTDFAKTKALESVDNNIADIMISYLAEVAGDLDYQQQKDYLYSAIEANKAAIKKDIENGI